MTEKLSPNFLNELFRISFRNAQVFEILEQYLEFHYLPTQEYKKIWKASKKHFSLFNELPTIGSLAEQNKTDSGFLDQLEQVRDAELVSVKVIIEQLESYLKDVKFINLYERVGDLREEGKKEEAIKELQDGVEEISRFSLQSEQYESVFRNFEYRYTKRTLENYSKSESESKSIFGIYPLDSRTNGGVDRGKTCLFTARSGVGKSKLLRWIAYSNARLGKRGLHFQFEGSKEECLLGYEAMITGSPYYDLKTTSVDDVRIKKAIENSNKVQGDVHIIAFEEFGTATMTDVRNACTEYIKVHGRIDYIVLDYLDEVDPGDGKRYSPNVEGEKARKQANAKFFTNLCVEFNCSGFTATQASDIPPSIWNDPNQVLTRTNIGGDKNLPNKFSFHITLNQTVDEKSNNIMRLYEDKYRNYRSGKTHSICTSFDFEKFFDSKRTRNLFSE